MCSQGFNERTHLKKILIEVPAVADHVVNSMPHAGSRLSRVVCAKQPSCKMADDVINAHVIESSRSDAFRPQEKAPMVRSILPHANHGRPREVAVLLQFLEVYLC